MKINRTSNLKYVVLLFCFVVFTQWQGIPVVMSQELIEPISKAHLISTIELNRREKNPLRKMNVPGYIRLINRYGVNFPLTAETEQEIRHAGAYFGSAQLDKLVIAIRTNYRPDEPTEAEMKEALLRSFVPRGGTRIGDGFAVDAIVVSGQVNLENFEKLGCAPPNYGPGYFCTYSFSASMTLRSNERSESAIRQVAAWESILKWALSGNYETATKKFVWVKDRWVISH